MVETSEVVIVGAGAAGCAVAYYLARSGVQATVIEEQDVAGQASGYAAGLLNPLQGHGIPGPMGAFAWESYQLHLKLWEDLQEETGLNLQGRTISSIRVAFEEADFSDMEDTLALFSATDGFEARWLNAREVHELDPRITPKSVGGLYSRGSAGVDSYQYTMALAEAAKKRGAVIRQGKVCGLEHSNGRMTGGRVTGVKLEDGMVSCDRVVLAMGPWSRQAEPWLGIYIPVDPLKGEILRFDLPAPALDYDLSGGGGSIYAKPDGQVWCGLTEEWKGFDRQASESARRSILESAVILIPELAHAKLVMHTACLRPVTPDWLPILGQAPGYENVYLATGAGKKGILLSPGIGKGIADLITKGDTELAISAFDPQRFTKP